MGGGGGGGGGWEMDGIGTGIDLIRSLHFH